MTQPRPSLPCTLLFALAATSPAQDSVADQLAAFARRPAADQERLVASLQERLQRDANPWTQALIACIADAATAAAPRHKQLPRKSPKQKPPAGERIEDPWLPDTSTYVFGVGAIETAPPDKDRAAAAAAGRRDAVHAALRGLLPHSDLAIASIERQLDRDASADHFAAFLVAWRHGDETFYEALDRTAGTADSLFYYDAMLGDFVANFASGKDAAAAKVRSGLQASHDALHRAFLSYRQYRGFREAVALTMVLPPDQGLPHRLARYEAKAEGAYSLREQVLMVLASEDWDVPKVLDAITASAPPMTQPLWSADYDPFPAWQAIFAGHQEQMIARAGDTDAFLAAATTQLRTWTTAIQTAARESLADDGRKRRRP